MRRRDLLASGPPALAAAWAAQQALAAAPLMQSASGAAPSLRSAARDAYIFLSPLVESAIARARVVGMVGVNALRHVRTLATPATRGVTTPNNDTLYSAAWIDLGGGPATLTLPPTGRRYASLALMDTYTNNFAILGTRTTGGEGGRFTLVGPGQATSDPMAIRSPTRWVWALSRVLVDGDADLPAVHAVQNAIRLEAAPAGRPVDAVARGAPWQTYFAGAAALLAESPPRATDLAILRRMAPLGIGPGLTFSPERFSPAQAAEIAAGVAEARRLVGDERGSMQVVDGWTYPRPSLGDFDQDYLFRAQVALTGLAALTPSEAVYMRAVAPDGGFEFAPGSAWRLRFPPGRRLPVDAFWSLTLYERTPENQLYMAANPLNRYSIGDRTPGLRASPDGGLDIWIGHADPGRARRSNWLPAPAGPFSLNLRAYLPRPELQDGRYRTPRLVRA